MGFHVESVSGIAGATLQSLTLSGKSTTLSCSFPEPRDVAQAPAAVMDDPLGDITIGGSSSSASLGDAFGDARVTSPSRMPSSKQACWRDSDLARCSEERAQYEARGETGTLGYAATLSRMGICLGAAGHHDDAVSTYHRAREVYEAIGGTSTTEY